MNTNRKVLSNRRASFAYHTLKIRLASRADAEAVEALRLSAYGRAQNLRLLDKTVMRWDDSDENHLVLVVENEHRELLSTLRAIKVVGEADFLSWTNIIAPPILEFPSLYLKTGSTAEAYERLGLNTLIKMEIIKHLIDSDIRSVVNTINQGTSRIPLLEKMGCTFLAPDLSRRTHTTSPFLFNTPLLMGILPALHFPIFMEGADPLMKQAFNALHREAKTETVFRAYLT